MIAVSVWLIRGSGFHLKLLARYIAVILVGLLSVELESGAVQCLPLMKRHLESLLL